MATLTLDPTNTKFSAFQLTEATDRREIKTGAVTNAIYSSGQLKHLIDATIVTSTQPQHNNLIQILGGGYYSDDFKITLPNEFVNLAYSSAPSNPLRLSGRANAGDQTIRVNFRTSNQIQVLTGTVFNIGTSTELYKVISQTGTGVIGTIGIYPRIAKAIASSSTLNFHAPMLSCNMVNTANVQKSQPGTNNYSTIGVKFSEI